jgi:hypothetical protein
MAPRSLLKAIHPEWSICIPQTLFWGLGLWRLWSASSFLSAAQLSCKCSHSSLLKATCPVGSLTWCEVAHMYHHVPHMVLLDLLHHVVHPDDYWVWPLSWGLKSGRLPFHAWGPIEQQVLTLVIAHTGVQPAVISFIWLQASPRFWQDLWCMPWWWSTVSTVWSIEGPSLLECAKQVTGHGTSGYEQGVVGTVREQSPQEPSHGEGRWSQSQDVTSTALGKEETVYAWKLIGKSIFREGAMWHVGGLLGNDRAMWHVGGLLENDWAMW